MRSVARPVVCGPTVAVAILAACGGGHSAEIVAPAPSTNAKPASTAPTPIDTTGLPRIRFSRGTTSGIHDDKLQAGATRSYVLFAQGGQVMLVHAIGWPVAEAEHPPADPEVRVLEAATGRELPSPRAEPEIWSGRLPSTGEFIVRVTASTPTAYTLAVQIPKRLEISPGEPTAVFTGTAPSRAPVDFLVRVDAGRTLEVSLGGAPTVGLHIYGLNDGAQLARLSDRQRLYAARVATSQDYVVSMVPWAERAAYDLRVTVR
ncbi:MAG TPA: hypothetical protein VFJ81_14145 [Gemmatimonadales bacterium]|nr:hypothetical protein [Gemmatimonadales bacterium]